MVRPLTSHEAYVSSAVWSLQQGLTEAATAVALARSFKHLSPEEIDFVMVETRLARAVSDRLLTAPPGQALGDAAAGYVGPSEELVVDVIVSWGGQNDRKYRTIRMSRNRGQTIQDLNDEIASALLEAQLEYQIDVGTSVWTIVAVYG